MRIDRLDQPAHLLLNICGTDRAWEQLRVFPRLLQVQNDAQRTGSGHDSSKRPFAVLIGMNGRGQECCQRIENFTSHILRKRTWVCSVLLTVVFHLNQPNGSVRLDGQNVHSFGSSDHRLKSSSVENPVVILGNLPSIRKSQSKVIDEDRSHISRPPEESGLTA